MGNAKRGDREAFEALVKLYRDDLDALVQTRLGDRLRQKVEPEDVVQETLLRAFQSLDRFQWQGESSFVRWLKGIGEHVILEVAGERRRKPQLPLEQDPTRDDPTPSKALRETERFQRLQAAFDSLSADHRRVIYLARIEKLRMKEVGSRMDRSVEAVTSLLWRALNELKKTFGETESLRLPDEQLRELEDSDGSKTL